MLAYFGFYCDLIESTLSPLHRIGRPMQNFRTIVMVLILSLSQFVAPNLHASETPVVESEPTVADRERDPEQYYRDIGREDIARRYAARRSTKTVGVVLVVASMAFFLASLTALTTEKDSELETQDRTASLVFAGAGTLVLAGGIFLITLPEDPLSPEEHKALEQELTWSSPQIGLRFRF